MAIVLRSVKGSRLTKEEVDGNFADLDGRLSGVESSLPAAARGIESIEQTGDELLFHMTDSTIEGPFTLEVADWTDTGDWLPVHYYVKNDLVHVNGSVYRVVANHTSPAVFDAGYSPAVGVDAYELLMAPPTLTQTMALQITEEDLANDVAQYLVAPADGAIVGFDAVVQQDLIGFGGEVSGHLQVKVNGFDVTGALLVFSSGALIAGDTESVEVTTWNFSKGDVISIWPTLFGTISGHSGHSGKINASIRFQATPS